VRFIGAFVDELDVRVLGFARFQPAATGAAALFGPHAAQALSVWAHESNPLLAHAGAGQPEPVLHSGH